ncbi:MAG: hypothetical protein AVDCRST_MAG38-2299 [uncultured Solirubrobacteraceae bacterium]|uniref:Uncharacterized protein n=1 Tax=uncultured Solirubrobacteraceae bacterium TaxID=1162706 RepID=A0A6J4RZ23_9ACTN|nr:MAG: hypothetical protein AVDCRST_MAG38-2299 [uncultured Solirubrobacteraceae bacterium]
MEAPLVGHRREDSMCRLVVDGQQRIVCADATRESRFSYSSFVQGPEAVRLLPLGADPRLRRDRGRDVPRLGHTSPGARRGAGAFGRNDGVGVHHAPRGRTQRRRWRVPTSRCTSARRVSGRLPRADPESGRRTAFPDPGGKPSASG